MVSWAQEAEKRGAGEILLTSVDHEGVGKGMNIDLINRVCNAVNIPVVAHGGIGCPIHVLEIAKQLPVSGLAISSILHYQYITKNKHLDGFEEEGNIEVSCEFCNEHYYFDKNEVFFIFSENSDSSVFNSDTVH